MIRCSFAVSLAAFRLSVLVTDDVIMNWMRDRVFLYSERTGNYRPYQWVKCRRCNGVWFVAILWVVYQFAPSFVWLIAAMGGQVGLSNLRELLGNVKTSDK